MNGREKKLIWEWLVLSGSLPPRTKRDIEFVRFKQKKNPRVLHLSGSTVLLKLELNGVQCVYRCPKQTEKGIDWGHIYIYILTLIESEHGTHLHHVLVIGHCLPFFALIFFLHDPLLLCQGQDFVMISTTRFMRTTDEYCMCFPDKMTTNLDNFSSLKGNAHSNCIGIDQNYEDISRE